MTWWPQRVHTHSNYYMHMCLRREHAWGSDNIAPISGTPQNSNFNHAVTMIDSLDTLWIMGMCECLCARGSLAYTGNNHPCFEHVHLMS